MFDQFVAKEKFSQLACNREIETGMVLADNFLE